MPGRPKKKRRRAAHEGGITVKGNIRRVSKQGITMTCQRCLEPGHNKKGCKNGPREKPPKVQKKMGRPPKKDVGQNVGGQDVGLDGIQRNVEHGGSQEGGQNVLDVGQNVGQEGGFSSQNQSVPNAVHGGSPSRWTKRKLFDVKEKLSPSKNFVIGSCSATTKTGVALGVSSAGFRNPKLFGVKGPRRLPTWWGAGVCTDPKTGETFIGGGDGVPVPAWPHGVPLPSASEIAKQKDQERKTSVMQTSTPKNTHVTPERRSPRFMNTSSQEATTPKNNNVIPKRSPRIMERSRKLSQDAQVKRRNPSERILKRKLGKLFDGPGDSSTNAMELE